MNYEVYTFFESKQCLNKGIYVGFGIFKELDGPVTYEFDLI